MSPIKKRKTRNASAVNDGVKEILNPLGGVICKNMLT